MPRISLVTPTFRRPHFLARALESVVGQTLTDFEVLVCDNGSDKATEDVVRAFDDARIHYVPRPENLGMLRNATLGMQDTSADLVMKLDDDDLLLPDALERLVEPLEQHPEVGLSFGGVALVDGDERDLTEQTATLNANSGREWFPQGLIRPATWLVASGGVQMAGGVVRKGVVDWANVPDEIATAYDTYVALAAVEDNRGAWFSPEPVVRYRIHEAADTVTNYTPQALGSLAVFRRALEGGRHGDRSALERRLAQGSFQAGRALTRQGDVVAARPLLKQSLHLQPSLEAARMLAVALTPAPAATGVIKAWDRITKNR